MGRGYAEGGGGRGCCEKRLIKQGRELKEMKKMLCLAATTHRAMCPLYLCLPCFTQDRESLRLLHVDGKANRQDLQRTQNCYKSVRLFVCLYVCLFVCSSPVLLRIMAYGICSCCLSYHGRVDATFKSPNTTKHSPNTIILACLPADVAINVTTSTIICPTQVMSAQRGMRCGAHHKKSTVVILSGRGTTELTHYEYTQ